MVDHEGPTGPSSNESDGLPELSDSGDPSDQHHASDDGVPADEASGEYEPIAVTGRKRMSGRTRLIAALAVACLIVAGGAWGAFALLGEEEPLPVAAAPSPSPAPTPTPEPEEPEPVHVIAMGDMLPHDSVHQNAQSEAGWDYTKFFNGVRTELDEADVTFCNQEVPSAGESFGVTGYPTFNAPTEFARDLREGVGCDLINLATNHTADKGTSGITATLEAWDGLGPAIVAGANRSPEEQRTVPIYEADGIRIALVSFAEYSNAPVDEVSLNLMNNDALVEELMGQAREQADVVIVSAHWGTEYAHEVNDQQRAFAQRVADLGADVIVGTGPHVLQAVTWLDRADGGETLVWYSIGNMLSTQLTLPQRTGVIAGFDLVQQEEDGAVLVENPTAEFTYMHYDWTAEEEAAGNLAARHTLSLTPLAVSQELLDRTRFGVTAEEQVRVSSDILGPDVTVVTD